MNPRPNHIDSKDIQTGKAVHLSGGDYVVNGDLPAGTHITVDGNLQVKGTIGDNSIIMAKKGFVQAKDVGNGVKITCWSAQLQDVGTACEIQSRSGGISAHNIGARTSLQAKDMGDIHFYDTENDVRATTAGNITCLMLGERGALKGGALSVQFAGNGSRLTATKQNIDLDKSGEHVQAFAAGFVNIKDEGSNNIIGSYIKRTGKTQPGELGAGIRYDGATKHYIFSERIAQRCGEDVFSEFMSQLVETGASIKEEVYFDDKLDLEKFYCVQAAPEHALREVLKTTIKQFVAAYRDKEK